MHFTPRFYIVSMTKFLSPLTRPLTPDQSSFSDEFTLSIGSRSSTVRACKASRQRELRHLRHLTRYLFLSIIIDNNLSLLIFDYRTIIYRYPQSIPRPTCLILEPDRYIYACVFFICLVFEACRETLQDYSIVV